MDKNLSLRWQCKLCKSRIYIIKTVDGDYLECPTCKAIMFSQVEENETVTTEIKPVDRAQEISKKFNIEC